MAHGPYPPGPTSRLPLGLDQSVYFARRPVEWLTRAAGYGDVARVHALGYDIYLLNHPDDVRDVLVTNRRNFDKGQTLRLLKGLIGEGLLTSEGDIHLRQRRLTQPAFHRQRVAEYATTITDYAQRLGARWTDGARRDIAWDMRTLSLSIVAKTVLDADIDGENAQLGDALNALLRWGERVILPPAIAEAMNQVPLPSTQAFNTARAYLNGLIEGLISERRATGADRGDLLSMLIQARDEDGDALSDEEVRDEEVRDEALTFFLAGQETTALALTWTWYAIARNPQVEVALHDELGRVLGGRAHGRRHAGAGLHQPGLLRGAAALPPGLSPHAARRRGVRDRGVSHRGRLRRGGQPLHNGYFCPTHRKGKKRLTDAPLALHLARSRCYARSQRLCRLSA